MLSRSGIPCGKHRAAAARRRERRGRKPIAPPSPPGRWKPRPGLPNAAGCPDGPGASYRHRLLAVCPGERRVISIEEGLREAADRVSGKIADLPDRCARSAHDDQSIMLSLPSSKANSARSSTPRGASRTAEHHRMEMLSRAPMRRCKSRLGHPPSRPSGRHRHNHAETAVLRRHRST